MDTVSTIPIEKFSVEEKLILMERIWEDLSSRPSDIPVPESHARILSGREAAVREGRTSFGEWEEAKERLRERLK